MVEFHGWITLRDTYSCNMEENLNFERVVANINKDIDSFDWCNGFHDIRTVNGEYQLIISGYLNHKSKEIDELFNIYEKIAKKAIGSYGLLYIHDDEDKEGYDNTFIVYALAKGKIKRYADNYLSPYIGIVEEQV